MAWTILITGCSSGICHDASHGLRAAGWRVFASCRKAEDCARLMAEGFESPRIDYEDAESIATGLAEVLEATGGTLDALFHNGAYAIPGAVEDLPTGALRQIFEANLFGWHELTRHVIPVMRAQGHGRIVMNSSVLGFVGLKWRGAYVATKHALEGLTDVLRLEMRDTPVKVILIEPGPDSAFRGLDRLAGQPARGSVPCEPSPPALRTRRAGPVRTASLGSDQGAPARAFVAEPARALPRHAAHEGDGHCRPAPARAASRRRSGAGLRSGPRSGFAFPGAPATSPAKGKHRT